LGQPVYQQQGQTSHSARMWKHQLACVFGSRQSQPNRTYCENCTIDAL